MNKNQYELELLGVSVSLDERSPWRASVPFLRSARRPNLRAHPMALLQWYIDHSSSCCDSPDGPSPIVSFSATAEMRDVLAQMAPCFTYSRSLALAFKNVTAATAALLNLVHNAVRPTPV